MKTEQKNGGFSGLVSRLSRQSARSDDASGRVAVEPRTVTAVAAETGYASKTLARFFDLLFARPAAVVLDLGPVIGSNITFLGERVDCKIHVEDLYADIDRHIQQDKLDELPASLSGRFPSLPDSSVDAVLGWDVFDYLNPMAATALASQLMRLLRPGGVFLGFFGARASDDPRYTKFIIEDETRLRFRFYPSACNRRWVLQNRDINIMFAGLEICETVLLKSGVREILFRKRILS